jgi:hypothetical protein
VPEAIFGFSRVSPERPREIAQAHRPLIRPGPSGRSTFSREGRRLGALNIGLLPLREKVPAGG